MTGKPEPLVEQNRAAWNAGRYEAWSQALGTPAEEAARLVADPAFKLRRLLPYLGPDLGDIAGRRFCNVQGSHGRVAVALALLGGEATVLDFAEENRRYALELAAAAGVAIDYRLGDVIEAGALGLDGSFDWLVMELGILHYHLDLERFFRVMAALLKPGGRLLLEEFHPVERKLFFEGGPADYFQAEPRVGVVPNPTGSSEVLGTCTLRNWTLGEIVTAAIAAGLRIDRLGESPGWIAPPTIPGIFTLLATRA
jgi:2-polyprenyl-3-methyl-5-hydroxy-6-metoxy-1,4-benzoquinol methylase